MRKVALVFVVYCVVADLAHGAPPPPEMVRSMTEAIVKHRPDAKIEVTDDGFVAKAGTMMFTLHNKSKSGEVYADTYRAEGPNFKGFLLRVAVNPGLYQGAAATPQTLQEAYFTTFIDAPATPAGDAHYAVGFSFGSRLDPELKKAIFEVIPKTKFQEGAVPGGGAR